MADAKRIVVVGGGIAGLAAARAAVLRGRESGRAVSVTLFEGSGRFGGNLLTEKADGFLLDAGPDSWVVTKPHATALARTLGLGGSLIETRSENPTVNAAPAAIAPALLCPVAHPASNEIPTAIMATTPDPGVRLAHGKVVVSSEIVKSRFILILGVRTAYSGCRHEAHIDRCDFTYLLDRWSLTASDAPAQPTCASASSTDEVQGAAHLGPGSGGTHGSAAAILESCSPPSMRSSV